MIELDGVVKRFGAATAVDGATLEVGRGELLALLGPSGCGKTTLLRLVAGFETPDAGTIRIHGRDVTRVAAERRAVGMVFQDYALFPHLTVAENVGFGLPRARRAERVQEALRLVNLHCLDERYPHELSGGQQQRVALARALAPEPEVILLDEPWSSIDPLLRGAMRDELARILRRAGTTVLLVTHDQEEALALADRVALMRDGRVVQVDAPETVYHHPADRWAAEFVGPANWVDGRLVRPELVLLEADPSGDGEVVEREFRGHDLLYRVRLHDGTVLRSQRPSNEAVPLGARVRVRVAAA
jgi:iron(III) transport system ATP-binding protein